MNKVESSYQAHVKNLKDKIGEKDERLLHIRNHDCLGYRVIKRTLDLLQPFFGNAEDWLTIGDYNGLEANYLLENRQGAVASDITDIFLKEAKKEELIKEYRIINVENIDYPEDSFDYLFCKEAFHHFPKAYIGLYEMIRCSKKATIIIEPIDIITRMPLLLFIKNILDRINPMLINKIWRNRFSFETVGNYVFKISDREFEKIAMGMGLKHIAFKKINLVLDLGLENSVILETPTNRAGWKKFRRKVRVKNFFSYLRIVPYNHLCCVAFKSEPSPEVRKKMRETGYVIIDLPENPYLQTMLNEN